MVYQIAPPGHATPYHLHHIEDEAFYVLDGEYTFICNGVKTAVATGRIYVPAAEEFLTEYESAVLLQRPC
jgi:uncharacterized cupin superfamily protein